MDKIITYWEYALKIYNQAEGIEETRCGVLSADNVKEAMDTIYSYYGDEIFEIESLKEIGDTLLDFKDIEEDEGYDFRFVRKEAE